MQSQSPVPLTGRDAPDIQRLYEQCTEYMLLVSDAPPAPDEAEILLQELPPGTSPDQKLVLGIRAADGELLGALDVVGGWPAPEVWYIGECLVAPGMRGTGVGRRLYQAAEQRAREGGARRMELAVHEANTGAYAFWSRMGFEEAERVRSVYKARESTFILMRKPLTDRE